MTVISREPDETFELDAAAEAELARAIGEADRGETRTAVEVLEELRQS